jgi:hypothetical protein
VVAARPVGHRATGGASVCHAPVDRHSRPEVDQDDTPRHAVEEGVALLLTPTAGGHGGFTAETFWGARGEREKKTGHKRESKHAP